MQAMIGVVYNVCNVELFPLKAFLEVTKGVKYRMMYCKIFKKE